MEFSVSISRTKFFWYEEHLYLYFIEKSSNYQRMKNSTVDTVTTLALMTNEGKEIIHVGFGHFNNLFCW